MRSWTDEQFLVAFDNATSVSQILKTLGLKPAGGNYSIVWSTIERLKLDKNKLSGQAWAKGKKLGPREDLKSFLVKGKRCSSHRLKLRLIVEEIFERKCYRCNGVEWLGNPIPLELEHIDGDHSNNELQNLTLLCPNCHALTETYRGKNKGKCTTVAMTM